MATRITIGRIISRGRCLTLDEREQSGGRKFESPSILRKNQDCAEEYGSPCRLNHGLVIDGNDNETDLEVTSDWSMGAICQCSRHLIRDKGVKGSCRDQHRKWKEKENSRMGRQSYPVNRIYAWKPWQTVARIARKEALPFLPVCHTAQLRWITCSRDLAVRLCSLWVRCIRQISQSSIEWNSR